MKIISGNANKPLAEKIAQELGITVSPTEIFIFPDGERRIRLEEEVVDEDVIIVQSTSTPVDEYYMELFFLADGAVRSGASSVTVVMPYMGYMRQDHIFRSGEAVSLAVVARMLETVGVDEVILYEPHTIKVPEFFHIPVRALSALSLFAETIKEKGWNDGNSVLVSPDLGGLNRLAKISELLGGMPTVATVKDRDVNVGTIEINSIEGDMGNIRKRAIIVDDMISSGKTIVKAAELLMKNGVEEVYVFVTHPIFSKEAPTLLQESAVTKVFVTDSVFIPEEKQFAKLEVLTLASTIAKEITAILS